ncbi:MAG: hypothetical protein M0Q90_01305 [Bacteroidales bacterium]|nr:hypothetical protein [Bacteroidales bacterium]
MKSKLFFLALTFLFLVSCQSTQQITGSYVNKEAIPENPFKKVFIMVMAHKDAPRAAVENQLADAAAKRGIKTVMSSDVFPIGFLADKPTKEEFAAEMRKHGCDAAFTVTLLHEQTQERYVPGSQGAPYVAYPFYGSYYNYYNMRYSYVYDPGYYTTDQIYFIEGNLYDLSTDKLVWSLQSKSYDPGTLTAFGKTYADMVFYQLRKEGLAKR